jgi:hypothetical protein
MSTALQPSRIDWGAIALWLAFFFQKVVREIQRIVPWSPHDKPDFALTKCDKP